MKISNKFIFRAFVKKGPPIHLIWFITNKCNLRCSHCFYFSEIADSSDCLSFDEIKKTAEKMSPVLSVNITGGEPFLRNDLFEITRLFAICGITDIMVLATNGFATERIVKTVEKIVKNSPDILFCIGVSLDGYKEINDMHRGIEGAYELSIQTIKELKKLQKYYSNLDVGLLMTLHKGNQDVLFKFRKQMMAEFGFNPGITIIRGTPKDVSLMDVDRKIYRSLIEDIEYDRRVKKKKTLFESLVDARIILGHKMAYDTFVSGRRNYDCYAGSLMGVIYENGDVFPCETLKAAKLGNLRENDFDLMKIWKSPHARDVRKYIQSRQCACTYECQYTTNTVYNIRYWPYFIKHIFEHSGRNSRGL